MSGEPTVLPGAEPFFFEGGDVGVLISHGFTGCPQSVRPLGEALARDGGLTVSCPRLRGHGTSPEDMARTSAEDWIRDLEAALDALRQRCRRLFVTGLSMGGTLTLYLAGTRPDVFAGAIPINAAVLGAGPELGAVAFAADAPATLPGVGSDIKKPGVTELAYPVIPTPTVRHLYALLGATRDLLPRVACPLLAFQAPEDHVVHRANAEYLIEHVGSTDKRLVWLENSYHVATLDHDAERIAAETLAFVCERS
ncbi:MAG: alpha/beta fold hydrolase [Myxococcota bacterium]|nr:alpha/beta fold hydrolase [Myxococcota bacterium]